MVWAAISERGKSPLVFVPQGVKINKERYIEDILEGALRPWYNSVYGDEAWSFQQDGATNHTARVTQQWCFRIGSVKKNGLLLHQILTHWTILSGRFWKLMPALFLAQILRF